VIDSGVNSFESGFLRSGQTKEHVNLVKGLGVDKIVIGMNKLDLIDYSKERYDLITKLLLSYLIEIGFVKENILFIPFVAFKGENLLTPFSQLKAK